MKKLKLGAILLLFISCNIRSQNGQSLLSKQNIDNNSDTGTEKIDYPVTINEVKIGTTPYFKMFKGEVESKKLTILMRRSNDDGVFRISNGYYYFNDEKKILRLRGEYLSSKTRKTNDLEDWRIELSDMFSSIPVNKDIYDDLDRYRFIGWVTQNSFVGVFSHPLIKPKSDLPKWFNAAIVENRAIKVNLPEIKTPFSNFSNKKKLGFSIEGSTLDSLTIYYSVTLPEGIPKLRQNVLEELLEQKRKYNIPVEDVLETHVLDYMKKESRIVSAFMKNRNVEYNSILFYYNIELPYVDSNLICFRSVKNTSYSPSRSTSSRSYIVEDTTKYLNYNIKTKEFIKVEDIFLDGSSEIIGKIVENSDDMRKFKSDETDLAFAMKPFDIKAFFLTSKGISFEFPPTPNYRSEVYIFVPYGDLSKYLKPNFKKKIAQW